MIKILYRTITFALCVFALYGGVRIFVADKFVIKGDSMTPTLYSGQNVWVNKLVFGPRIYKSVDFSSGKLSCFRLPGIRNLRAGDICVFNCPRDWFERKIEFKINHVYAKRCVGCPGDTISIYDSHIINSSCPDGVGVPFENEKKLYDIPYQELIADGNYWAGEWGFPLYWNIQEFGPLPIPSSGQTVTLDSLNRLLYKSIIEYETGGHEAMDDSNAYTFCHDYYFFVGDNIVNSFDSRYIGLVPDDYIVGVVSPRFNLKRELMRHYRGDKYRRKAARYLLSNLRSHWSYEPYAFREFCDSLACLLSTTCLSDEVVEKARILSESFFSSAKRVPDTDILTPYFLIRNIDRAFETWAQSPYLKQLTFDEMCEYVLPYKTRDGQPCDDWREYAHYPQEMWPRFLDEIDDFKYEPMAAAFVADSLLSLSFRQKKMYPYHNLALPVIDDYSCLSSIPFTTCRHSASLGLINYRANGIPAACDFIPSYSDRNDSHCWIATVSKTSRGRSFVPFENYIAEEQTQFARIPKVYRVSYCANHKFKSAILSGARFPSSLDLFSYDVTDRYCMTGNVRVHLNRKYLNRWVFIAVPDKDGWIPVDCARCLFGSAYFKNMGLNSTYIVMSYDRNGNPHPVSAPFYLEGTGEITKYVADEDNRIGVTIHRKYPAFSHIWKIREELGEVIVEGSNYYHFEQSDTLGIIPADALLGETFRVDRPWKKHRYVRVRAIGGKPSCMAEIYFYQNGEMVHPTIVEEGKSYEGCPECYHSYTIEDNDALSYFRLEGNEHFLQYDFLDSLAIDQVSYIRRGDGNDIIPGDCYLVCYWDGSSWCEIERQVANKTYLRIENIPAGGLYYIRDVTRGVQNRVFSIEDNKVVWR